MVAVSSVSKKLVLLLYLAFSALAANVQCEGIHAGKWTILIYLQAKNNLSRYVGRNLRAVASAKGVFDRNNNVNVITQLERPGNTEAERFVVLSGGSYNIMTCPIVEPMDPAKRLVDFVKWGVKNFPAEHYCLILWSHGNGVLPWQWRTRGILTDDENKTTLENSELKWVVEQIASDQILGRKLDCLGCDACLMSMIEIGFQVRRSVRYMVGSEEVEPASGWNYFDFIARSASEIPGPQGLAEIIVQTYGKMYSNVGGGKCTQSAIDLDKVNAITKCMNEMVVELVGSMGERDVGFVAEAVRKARRKCVKFWTSNPVYIDLHSFCSKLLDHLSTPQHRGIWSWLTGSSSEEKIREEPPHMKKLIESIKATMAAIEQAVICNATSKRYEGAKGLSIYFPLDEIDPSYRECEFGKNSMWVEFLEHMHKLWKKKSPEQEVKTCT
jgi:hypothetical protein